MNKRRSLLGMTGAVVALVALSGSVMAADSSNGSFEAGTYTDHAGLLGDGYQTITAGTPQATAISGWTVTAGQVDWINGWWPAADGDKSIDLSGLEPGAISQTFQTTTNVRYFVSFKLAGNPDAGPAVKTLTVAASGNTGQSYVTTPGSTHAAMGWTDEGYSFVAKGSSTTITFTSTTDGSWGPVIDKVVVTEGIAATGASCKDDGWKNMSDAAGIAFKNQGLCVSFYAKNGTTPIGR